MANIYRAHATFVYPSIATQGETFGLAPLESMSCGAVPIVSNLPCFTEYLSAGENGWVVDYQDTNPVSTLANTLVQAGVDHAAMRQSAITTASRFSVANVAAAWISAFETWVNS
ncbi:MAG: glycosyltransferase [Ahniella sp.]|nr:glycosyltransferase [Ahniella sp.]